LWGLVTSQVTGAAEGPAKPLVVGSEQDFPPLALGQTDETAGGFTVELWKAVAQEQGLSHTLRVRPFAQLLQEFKAGEIDVLINLAQSDARREFADFTVPHVIIHGAVFVRREESQIRSEADLAGKRVIVINADLAHDYAVGRGWARQLVPVATAEEGFKLLAAGQHDALLMSKLVGLRTLAQARIKGIRVLPEQAGFHQKFSFAVRKGEAALLARLNEGLAVSKSSGRYDALYEQWLGVYDPKLLTLWDVFKIGVPLLAGLVAWQAYFLHRSRLNRQRRAAAAALQRSQEHLEAIINSVAGIVWEADAATFRFTFVSPQAERLLGYPVSQWLTELRFWTSHLHPDDREEVVRHCIKCTREQRNHELEYRMHAADGRVVWLRDFVTVVVEQDRVVKLRGIMVDITDQKRTESALRESEHKFGTLVRNNPAAIAIFTLAEGRILEANESYCRLLGYSREELIGRTTIELGLNADPAERERNVATLRREGRLQNIEASFRHRSGALRRVIIASELVELGGQPVILGIAQDITERQQAEEELRRRQQQLDALIGNLPGFVYRCRNDRDWTLEFVSRGILEITGHPPERFLRGELHFGGLIHPDDAERVWSEVQQGVRERRRYQLEYRIRRGDGSEAWVWEQGAGVHDADGQLLALEGIVTDATVRIQAEQRLRQLSSAVEQTDDSVLIANREGVIEYVNAGFEKMTGYLAAEAVGQTPRLLKSDQQPPAFFEQLWQTITAGRPFRAEFVNRCKDGTTYHEEKVITPLRNARGEITHYVSVGRDISRRKLVEAALEESRQTVERAQQIGHVGSWVSDPGPQGALAWSAEACRIFGFAPGEFDGRVETFFALVHPEDRDVVARASRAALAGTRKYDLEHRIVRRDGQVRWVHEQADVERDAAGQPVRMVGVVQDITERRQLEEQLRHAQRMDAMGQLAGGVAHDFNNLLSSILGNTELATLYPPGSREAGESLEAVLAASRRARDLVRQILAFSRRQEQQREPMQLHQVVREALDLMRASVPASVEFRSNVAVVPSVLADASEMHQVVMNLCTNAWHALPGGAGVIQVELAEAEVGEALARLQPDLRPGRYVRLTVADNGCGMDEATRARIFEPFFTTKPVGEGTGLGLAVVHGIVKSHDGGIVVSSHLGRGTTFALYFPVFEAEVVEPPAVPQPVPRGHGEHILFVDDEAPLARMGRAALKRLGYRVTAATSPMEALAIFSADPAQFDLVITDLNMPGINGTELARRLAALRPDLRLVLTTGYSAVVTRDSVFAHGFRELLPKPYDLRSLGETTHRALHGTNLTRRP